jgi:ribonuclease VapC
MIVVDSSALIAIFENEIDANVYAKAIKEADRLLVSAINVHENGIVIHARRGMVAAKRMWHFLQVENDFEIMPFDEVQAHEALSAFARYGKGIDPKARLNLADCAAYALAKTLDVPLLFKGNDFAQTDIKSAL